MGRGAEGGRGRDPEVGGYQLTRELALQEIGEELAVAGRELTWGQKMDVAAALLESLRKPVGKLGREN